jgi:hypothetical protein
MPFNLLLLPLLGGYIFARKYYRTRYSALRSENYSLLFLAAQYGLVFLAIAATVRALWVLLRYFVPTLIVVNKLWHALFPFDYSGTAILALLFGATSWRYFNRGLSSDEEVDKAIREKGDPLEVLLKDAMRDTRPVLLTMKSGKVYVGAVTTNFNPAYEVQSIKIMPILSGYRDPKDQTVTFTTDYFSLLTQIHDQDPNVTEQDGLDLGTVIPLDEIRSVGIFSLPAYKRHFSTHHPAQNLASP